MRIPCLMKCDPWERCSTDSEHSTSAEYRYELRTQISRMEYGLVMAPDAAASLVNPGWERSYINFLLCVLEIVITVEIVWNWWKQEKVVNRMKLCKIEDESNRATAWRKLWLRVHVPKLLNISPRSLTASGPRRCPWNQVVLASFVVFE